MSETDSSKNQVCDLCKQPVELQGFCLQTTEGEKKFCCEGCVCVYQLLNEDKILPDNNN